MARATSEGHRVILVVATDGAAGLTSQEFRNDLAGTRRAEVEALVKFYENKDNVDWNVKVRAAKVVFNPVIQRIAEKKQCTYEEAAAWYNEKLMADLDAM
jgi:hypothetical protein